MALLLTNISATWNLRTELKNIILNIKDNNATPETVYKTFKDVVDLEGSVPLELFPIFILDTVEENKVVAGKNPSNCFYTCYAIFNNINESFAETFSQAISLTSQELSLPSLVGAKKLKFNVSSILKGAGLPRKLFPNEEIRLPFWSAEIIIEVASMGY